MRISFLRASLVAALASAPALCHADGTQWEVIQMHELANGRTIAVVVPANWQELETARVLGAGSRLRYMNESGAEVEIPAAELVRASARTRVLSSEDTRRLALQSKR